MDRTVLNRTVMDRTVLDETVLNRKVLYRTVLNGTVLGSVLVVSPLVPSPHAFGPHFVCLKVMDLKIRGGGLGWLDPVMDTFRHFFHKVSFKCGRFWEVLFSPFFVTKNQMCPIDSMTSENKGGGGGFGPLTEEFHS